MGGKIGLPTTDPMTSPEGKGPLLKPYQIIELRQGDPPRSSPPKDASGDCGSDTPTITLSALQRPRT